MNSSKNTFLARLSAFVFGAIFLSVAVLLGLTFFVPESKIRKLENTLDYPIAQVWKAIYEPSHYLKAKKEITKYKIYDTVLPHWTEYYTPQDSIENKTTKVIQQMKLTYGIINKKHQQVNAFSFKLEAVNDKQTKLIIYEKSRYFNVWGSIYFQLFRPNTVIDYEYVKITNTLKYIDSLNKQ
jgi:hypothetical protein